MKPEVNHGIENYDFEYGVVSVNILIDLFEQYIHTNPGLIKTLRNMPFPLPTKYECNIENRDEDDI